jgi:hypothetical protein
MGIAYIKDSTYFCFTSEVNQSRYKCHCTLRQEMDCKMYMGKYGMFGDNVEIIAIREI